MNFSDLARQLNVSTATVSRALSRPDKVAPATRKRVLEFVRRSGYHINGIARSLRTQSTQGEKRAKTLIFEPELIVRRSTCPPKRG